MYLLGFDIGSSSVKASLVSGETGDCIASAFFPKQEMEIIAQKSGWAEQEPETWWKNLKLALKEVMDKAAVTPASINSIGISYQMHGLVMVDKNQDVIRPSIIWCDSRATTIGDKAFGDIGHEKCLASLLNSPGNFTASKLKWVKEFEPENYARIHKIMLPGDYIAMRMSGEIQTTASGLSEGIMWDYTTNEPAWFLLDYYGISRDFLPDIVPTFSEQARLSKQAAAELGLSEGTPVCYRAGDQPNNALSLNVLEPGEIAATAGTSGVVYGISEEIKYDPQSRVNTFAHVNHSVSSPRLGVLLCINGTGILNAWMKKNVGEKLSYEEMNQLASEVPVGADGLSILPFGNGAERVLNNQNPGAYVNGLDFNRHNQKHLFRAAQEGIVFSFQYGMEIMEKTGIDARVIRAGKANMFLSPLFRSTLASITGAHIELYDTDGSIGAARGAGIGSGYYTGPKEAFGSLKKLDIIEPETKHHPAYQDAYANWKLNLEKILHKS